MSQNNKIIITNLGSTSGQLSMSDGMEVELRPPKLSSPSDQLSPKHMIGMAWSTCLNATIIHIFKSEKIENKSRVRVEVIQKTSKDYGLHYVVSAFVAIEGYNENETLRVANTADRLCPISKLITNNPHVSLKYEEY